LTRRAVLAAGALALAGCAAREARRRLQGGWVGARARTRPPLRDLAKFDCQPCTAAQAAVLIVGAGIAGLAAARGFAAPVSTTCSCWNWKTSAGGNSRGHALGGMACPLGAHYLPLPAPDAHEVSHGCTSWACCARSWAAPWPTNATCATARRSACSSTAPGPKACCHRPTRRRPRPAQYRLCAGVPGAARAKPRAGRRAFSMPRTAAPGPRLADARRARPSRLARRSRA
jgi:hypothetical protein